MRILVPAAAALLLAACASTPAPVVPQPPVAAPALPPERGGLTGLTARELVARLGPARLQVREGDGTRMQFAAPACVLDAFLYPAPGRPAPGVVTHVETRLRDGRDTAQAPCLAALEAR